MHRSLQQLAGEVWAIDRSALERMVARVVSDETLPTDLFAALNAEQQAELDRRFAITRPGPKSGNVAIVPIRGPIMKRDSLWTWLFGGTSCERLQAMLSQLVGDDTVSTILLDVDSPGGTVSGMPECAAAVRSAAASKNVVAIANDLCASAAYWLASQADEVVATPEALTGSIGVFTIHEDWSRFWDTMGISITYVQAGRYKTEGNPDQPLSDEGKAHIQSIVDDAYNLFVNDVATGRNTDAATVKADYGEGRVFRAKDAKAAGMVDRVAMFGDTVLRLTGTRGTSAMLAGWTPVADYAAAGTSTLVAAAVDPHETDTDDDPWDAGEEEQKLPSPMPEETGRAAYAWVDDSQVEDGQMPKAAGKLLHHRVSDAGEPGVASTIACSSVIAALNGSRGGVDIPDEDRQGVYDHAAKHLSDADKEPPELADAATRVRNRTARWRTHAL